jgi:hypothetical protein
LSSQTKSSGRVKTRSATVAGRETRKPWAISKTRFVPLKTTKPKTKATKPTTIPKKKTKPKIQKKSIYKAPYRDIFGKYAVRPKPIKKRRKVVPKPIKPVKRLRKPTPKRPIKPVKRLRKPIKPAVKVPPKKKPAVKPVKKVAKPSKSIGKKPGKKKLAAKPVKPSPKKPVKKKLVKKPTKPVKKKPAKKAIPAKPVKKKKPVKKAPPEIPKRRIPQIFGANRREKIRPITQEDRERLKEASLDIEEVRIQTRRLKLPFGPTEISPVGYEYYELIAALEKMSPHDVFTLFMSPK